MKLRALLTTLAIGAAATLTTSPAHAAGACDSYTCLAGMAGVGTPGGPACTALVRPFFNIIIYDEEGIDYPATSAARRVYLMTCPGAHAGTNAAILNTIITEYGMVIR